MNTQLELPMESPDDVGGDLAPPALPTFVLTEDSTPAEIVAWWDELVAAFTHEAEAIRPELAPLDVALAALKGQRTGEARRRGAELRAARTRLLARVEAMEFAAYGLFEGTLSEFSPRLITLMQAAGLNVPDDEEWAVANFWDCLQRPAIEWCAEMPLKEIVREFCREN